MKEIERLAFQIHSTMRKIDALMLSLEGKKSQNFGYWKVKVDRFDFTDAFLSFLRKASIIVLPVVLILFSFLFIPSIFGNPASYTTYDQLSRFASVQIDEDFIKITNTQGAGGMEIGLSDTNNAGLRFFFYKVKGGETIYSVAKKLHMDVDTLISLNDGVSELSPGQRIIVPNMQGILYTVRKGDTLALLSGKYHIKSSDLLDANDRESETLTEGEILFLPGAKLSEYEKAKILGYLFYKPLHGRIASDFGIRKDPFTGSPAYHTGVDITAPTGTPVGSAKEGTVTFAGWQGGYGNCVIIRHNFGYETVYGHLSTINTEVGLYVNAGAFIGRVGTTGRSTGPHLHFEVRKFGRPISPARQVGLAYSGRWF